MSKSIRLLAILGIVGTIAACAPQAPVEEFVILEQEPINQEPLYTGKYK